MGKHRLEPAGSIRRGVLVTEVLQLFEIARRIRSGRPVLGDAVAYRARIGLTDRNATEVPDADVPALVHLSGAALTARTPIAVGQSAVEGRFRRLARHRYRIKLHVDGGQRRFNEKWHQEEEGEQTEHGHQ